MFMNEFTLTYTCLCKIKATAVTDVRVTDVRYNNTCG